MSTSGSTLRNLTIFLLVVVVGFGGYLLIYVQNREILLARLHLRVLLNGGNAASEQIEGLFGNVRAAASPKQVEFVPGADKTTTIRKRLAQIPDLEFLESRAIALQTSLADSSFLQHITDKEGGDFTLRIGVLLVDQGSDAFLRFETRRQYDSPKESAVTNVCQMELRKLVGRALPSEFFDSILLARSNGDVLVQEGASHIRLLRLPRARAARESLAAAGPWSRIYDLTMAGEKFKVFVQPMRLPILIRHRAPGDSSWEVEDQWLVAGFIPAARYRAKTMEIQPTLVLVVVGLIVLGLLCLPILKVRFMGAREELRHLDVVTLAIALVVATSLTTFALLFANLHHEGGARTQQALRALSGDLRRKMTAEFQGMSEALSRITQFRRYQWVEGEGFDPVGLTAILERHNDIMNRFPFLEIVFWMDGDGLQTSKWSIRSQSAPLNNVADRMYFSEALRGQVWPGDSASSDLFPGHYVESIRSKSTGQEFAVLSRTMKAGALTGRVAAIESRLRSVTSPVLPPGETFAVVDRRGWVQFHSNPARNLRENLFDELRSERAIRAAVSSGQVAFARDYYRAQPTALLVTPLPGTPWSLVTMKDLRGFAFQLLEVLTQSLALYALYGVFLMVIGWVILRGGGARRRAGEAYSIWFWPHPHRGPQYGALIAGYLILGALWTILARILDRSFLLLSPFLLALTVLVLFRAVLVPGPAGETSTASENKPAPKAPEKSSTIDRTLRSFVQGVDLISKPLSSSQRYLVMIVIALVLVGVLPAIGFWWAVQTDEEIFQLKDQQVEFAAALDLRRLDQLDWFKGVPLDDVSCAQIAQNAFATSDTSKALGFYAPPGWSWSYRALGDRDWKQGLWPLKELFTESWRASMASRGIAMECRSPAGDAVIQWLVSRPRRLEGSPGDSIWCVHDRPVPATGIGAFTGDSLSTRFQTLSVVSPIPSVPMAWPYWLMAVLGLGLLVWVVSGCLHYVFLSGWALPRPFDGREILENTLNVSRGVLLRFETPKGLAADCHRIGIAEIRKAKNGRSLVEAAAQSGKSGVILAEFDHGLKEPKIIQRKLELIEGLNGLDPPRKIYIESLVEPLYFLTERSQDHYPKQRELGIEIERWAVALAPYPRLRLRREEVSQKEPTTGIEVLCQELREHPPLEQLNSNLGLEKRFQGFSREEAVDAVLDLATPHYRSLWTCCSSEEKLLLYRVARQGFVNRRAEKTLRPLIRRGLVRLDPNCRIMNESFRRFILGAERPEAIAKWERIGGVSAWSKMKRPILLSILALFAFFFATQREAFNQSLAVLAALAASVPAAMNLIGNLSKLGQASTSKT